MITVENVSKEYKIYRSPADRLKEIVLRKKYHKELQALSHISFSVADGETLGIVGENGAGKSTLLKILQGVVIPDEGKVTVTGKVTGLLELGTGFNPELSGVENIYMNGTMLGMGKTELDEKKSDIIEFTELGDAINDPIKTYSSGMLMRLGFSIAIHAEPACFLVDEALSVGDAYFQQKCMRAIQAFKDRGGSIIFVSHDMNAVKILCDSAIMLDHGNFVIGGFTKEVVDYYQNVLLKKSHKGNKEELKIESTAKSGWQNHSDLKDSSIEILSMKLLSKGGEVIDSIVSEEDLILDVKFKSSRVLKEPHIGFTIRNKFGQVIFDTSSWWLGWRSSCYDPNTILHVQFKMNVPLCPGDYSFSLGIADKPIGKGLYEDYLFMAHDMVILKVIVNNNSILYGGVFNIKPAFSVISD